MTVSSTFRRAGPYAGNGSQTQYPFNFKVFIKEDLRVVRTINFDDNVGRYKSGGDTINTNSNVHSHGDIIFDASRVVPTGGDNRPLNMSVIPRQKR